MQSKIFKTLCPHSTKDVFHVTKNDVITLKTYNQYNIKQSCMFTVRLMQRDKIARCRFFVVPGDDNTLLGIADIELVCILKIMCEVVEGQQADRKFGSQTMKLSTASGCKANTDWESRYDNMDIINTNPNTRLLQVQHRQRSRQKGKLVNNTKNSQ